MDHTHRRPSWIFLAVLGLFLVSGGVLWVSDGVSIGVRMLVFLFVVSGWVTSLCLHEFGHALTAFKGGDWTIPEKGYLTLNPLKYTNALLSIILPLIFVVLGGIGLPGGAVWVQTRLLRSKRIDSLVSAMGPLSNAIFAVALAVFAANWSGGHVAFFSGIAYLAMLQVTATVLNLLPVPGLDGFGIIEPWLAPDTSRKAAKIAPWGLIGVFVLLWHPWINGVFFDFVYWILELLGVPLQLVGLGGGLFRFWRI